MVTKHPHNKQQNQQTKRNIRGEDSKKISLVLQLLWDDSPRAEELLLLPLVQAKLLLQLAKRVLQVLQALLIQPYPLPTHRFPPALLARQKLRPPLLA